MIDGQGALAYLETIKFSDNAFVNPSPPLIEYIHTNNDTEETGKSKSDTIQARISSRQAPDPILIQLVATSAGLS